MREIKWTYDTCKQEALKYKTRMEFKGGSGGAYSTSVKHKWLNNICVHMTNRNPPNYWTFETCRQEALKYKTRGEFSKVSRWGYGSALKNGWLDHICSHMSIVGNLKKRCVYSYEFPNNHVYVGLTYSFERRWVRRMMDNKDIVNNFITQTKSTPIKRRLTEYIPIGDAQFMEKVFVEKYQQRGWIILNRVKTGSLGGNIIKWTHEVCKREALKYSTFIEFREKNGNCLAAIYKQKWYNILGHLKYVKYPNKFWTRDECLKSAKLCKHKTEFYKRFKGAYASSKKNGWFDDVTKHMIKFKRHFNNEKL